MTAREADATRIVLCGATGRTGNAVAHVLAAAAEGVQLAAVIAPSVASTPSRPLPDGVPAFAHLTDALEHVDRTAVVVVDLTHAGPALEHARIALAAGISAVIGATGLDGAALDALGSQYAAADLGLLLVPNFSIGAVLMMRMAREAARYMPDVEIIELHHEHKRDSPSGTAVHTARQIAAARDASAMPTNAVDDDGPARGTDVDGIRVHALRLPGASAHQSVVFGAPGELLTIRHDAPDRSCYASGVARAARGVRDLVGLHVGLDAVL